MVAAQQRDQSGRERITDAAAELFLRNGYAQTSLRDIAATVGIKAGSIYYHFDSKEALFADILSQGIRVMEDAFALVSTETRDGDGETRVRRHIGGHLSALFEHGPYTTNHVSAFHIAPPSVKEAVIPARDRYEGAWVALFDDLVARGEMKGDMSPSLVRLSLFGAMNFAVEWFDPTRGNLDELVTVIARQFWSGVGTR
ncbi:MAG: TetR/AcrR family transcriptional regulator [Acidimicrobiia bacterium]